MSIFPGSALFKSLVKTPRNARSQKAAGLSVVIGAAAVAALASPAAAQSSPLGVWLNDTGRGAIEITDCNGNLCGEVVWVNDPKDSNGCGRKILGNVKKVGSDIWDNGWVYSPERKKRYDVELKLVSDDKLRVKGYAGIKMFSKTMIWTRAPADLKRCGDAPSQPNEQIATREAPAAPEARANTETDVRRDAPVNEVGRSDTDPARASDRDVRDTAEPTRQARVEPREEPRNDERETDAANERESEETSGSGRRGIDLGSLDLGDINIDKIFTRTESGECKLDTPWVKLNFKCRDRSESATN